jgi:hypothetical protein
MIEEKMGDVMLNKAIHDLQSDCFSHRTSFLRHFTTSSLFLSTVIIKDQLVHERSLMLLQTDR